MRPVYLPTPTWPDIFMSSAMNVAPSLLGALLFGSIVAEFTWALSMVKP